ncbi:hypothetical protein S7711_04682 [Stachybotrys chartarum IBT 7711]|uniref:Myb-like domain-containing protein n=1 Tax=Stachybotrys chartarum (strain CBS 109288 / IBT 7711) TaxID=1280523 RepID=A0A084B640_STACB|nr:hypothetical protein S7711_04682 [Stachybotrys chartarum IBT 7711]KFA55654.1 hypothetical protein S40293_05258 [Stachybotrys chartarum IBT 40293]
MPKHTRSSSGSQNRSSAYSIPVTVTPASMYAAQAQPRMTVSQAGYYTVGPSSAAAMPLAPQSHHAAAAAVSFDVYTDTTPATDLMPSATPTQHRPSSGAWSPHDDQQLITARMQGLNWAQIKDTYFPSKTGNACRKRHERLMDRKGTDDWDARRSQQLALDYMSIRKEIWSPLAVRTGEKWQVVEQKCLGHGYKNLQSLARAAARRDRLEGNASHSGYDDDSGISGIGLTPVDELDASYSSPETNASPSGPHAAAAVAGYMSAHHHQQHQHQQQHHHHQQQLHPHAQAHLQPLGANGYGMGGYGGAYHGYSSSVSSNASAAGHGYHGGSQGGSPYMQGQRQSSADMGIEAIMNRPGRRV